MDYTSKAPEDLEQVRQNLEIISVVLDTAYDIYNVQLFIQKVQRYIFNHSLLSILLQLKERIYTKLESFCSTWIGLLFESLAKDSGTIPSGDLKVINSSA